MLVAAFLFVLLILPLFRKVIDYNVLRVRREACASVLEASLSVAYLAVSGDSLSLGRLSFDQEKARNDIGRQLRRNTANARMAADLAMLDLSFSTVTRREDARHWLSRQRPDAMPVISATAEWIFRDGQVCRVSDRIELVLD